MASFTTPVPPGFATLEAAHVEMLECARYGDSDDLLALLSHPSTDVNYKNPQGTTALHNACANGHETCCSHILAQEEVLHLANDAGNTPLHWASTNGHKKVVGLLLKRFPDIDVLEKNKFGKSSLTEGFTSENTELIGSLLEHDSATEDKLLQGLPEKQDVPAETTHSLLLGKGKKVVKVRELEMSNADQPFTDENQLDTTGMSIWAGSIISGRWMAKLSEGGEFDNKSVIELGAGCGVPGFSIAVYGNAKKVSTTDFNADTLANLEHNIEINKGNYGGTVVAGKRVDWEDEGTWTKNCSAIVGCDLVYSNEIVPLLLSIVNGSSSQGCKFYYTAPNDGRQGLEEFRAGIEQLGWKKEFEEEAEEEFLGNPLESGDDDMAFLCFGEMKEKKFVNYIWVKE
ncbi:hypothetical protein TrVE_jg11100 [Triparma verrucosa]|uniref:Uncharacterized protein n=1 Tax=Triparma verrucosa TaxID=1606542 RepID=A0A9W7C144_9STRA|nr:hypothetical protein TrVE_jg11100 [Triparma verrucosa]